MGEESNKFQEKMVKFQKEIKEDNKGADLPNNVVDITWKDKNGGNIFHYAALYGDKEVFEQLFQQCVEQKNYSALRALRKGLSVLEYAAYSKNKNSTEIFEFLHKQNPSLFFELVGRTPNFLGLLMLSNNEDNSINRIIDILFQNEKVLSSEYAKTSVYIPFSRERSSHVLQAAICRGRTNVVNKLLDVLGPDCKINTIVLLSEKGGKSLLWMALKKNPVEMDIVKALCDRGAYDNTPLNIVAGQYPSMQYTDWSALYVAIEQKNIDAITAIIRSKADRCYLDKSTRSRTFYQNLHDAVQNPGYVNEVADAVARRGDLQIEEGGQTHKITQTQDLASIIVGVAKKSKGWLKDNENDWKLISGILTNQSLRNENKKEIVELALQEIRSNKLRIKLIASLGDEDLIKSLSIPSRPSLYQAAKEWFGFYNEPKIITEKSVVQASNNSSNNDQSLQYNNLTPGQGAVQKSSTSEKERLWTERVIRRPEQEAALKIVKNTPTKEVELSKWANKVNSSGNKSRKPEDDRFSM